MATPLPGASLPLEYLHEYDDAALYLARRGLTGATGDPLPANMGSPGALDYIQADPEAFQQRVRDMAYWLAFETPAHQEGYLHPRSRGKLNVELGL